MSIALRQTKTNSNWAEYFTEIFKFNYPSDSSTFNAEHEGNRNFFQNKGLITVTQSKELKIRMRHTHSMRRVAALLNATEVLVSKFEMRPN